jgi:hypothetical protein
MALETVQSGMYPLGQFDGLDSIYLNVKGGEVATITSTLLTSGDSAAADANGSDGYVGLNRPVVTTNLVSGNRPLFLVDDGITGYGTLFGSVIGGVCGQKNGTAIGPHTAAASGKLTLWDKPGMYAVTLDAVDPATSTGLQPTNSTLSIGDKLYASAAGLLTPYLPLAFENYTIARFMNFESAKGGTLVTTPINLVSAKNSPVGVGQPQGFKFARALIHFHLGV